MAIIVLQGLPAGHTRSRQRKECPMPSKEHEGSSIVSLRLSDDLLERLDRYLDWMETARREKSSRNHAIRAALTLWLDQQEQQAGIARPDQARRDFRAAYDRVRHGQDPVRIHRIRHALHWPHDHFDAVLEQFRADYHVDLHSGDPSRLSDAERYDSYQVNGQLYLSLSWRE
jgi:predicted transcriptional regulator